jgi:dihydroneopterin aldolase
VRERLQALYREHKLTLLESFAETIAAMLIVDFGAAWVRVKVVKPRKFDDVDAVGVMIERTAAVSDQPPKASGVLRLIGAGMVPGGH